MFGNNCFGSVEASGLHSYNNEFFLLLSESIICSDTRESKIFRQFLLAISLNDTFSSAMIYTKSFIESIQLIPSTIFSTAKNIKENITILSSMTSAGVFYRSILESISISATMAKSAARSIGEFLSILDIKSIHTSISKTDTISVIGDVFPAFSKAFSEAIIVSANITKSVIINISESLEVVGSIIKKTVISKADNISISEHLDRRRFYQFVEEIVVYPSLLFTRFKSISESILVKDTIKNKLNGVLVAWSRSRLNPGNWGKSSLNIGDWRRKER